MKYKIAVRPLLLGFLAAFFWGTHSTIVRFLSADMPGIVSATARVYIAAISLFLILKIYRRPVTFDLRDRNSLVCAAALTVNFVFFHAGLTYTSASNAMLLENTAPIFVLAILLVAFHERPNGLEIAATLIAFAGVYLTVQHDLTVGGAILRGDSLEIAAGVTWAVFLVSASKAAGAQGSIFVRVNFLLNLFAFAAVVLTPFALASVMVASFAITPTDAALLVLLGVFPTAIAYFLWYEAASEISTVASALLFTLTVVFTFANAAVFLGEVITVPMTIGGCLIVVGVLLSKLKAADG